MEITDNIIRGFMALASVGGGFKTTEDSNVIFIEGTNNVAAHVTFDDVIPVGVSILDTSKMVRLIRMVNGKNIIWGKESVVISGTRGDAKVSYCLPGVLSDQLELPDESDIETLVEFGLDKEEFGLVTNGMFDSVTVSYSEDIVKCIANGVGTSITVDCAPTDSSGASGTETFKNLNSLIPPVEKYTAKIIDVSGGIKMLEMFEEGIRYFVTPDMGDSDDED